MTPPPWCKMKVRTTGKLKLTWVEVVSKDLGACDLMADMALDRVDGGTGLE